MVHKTIPRPLHDYILAIKDSGETTSSGGIVLPDGTGKGSPWRCAVAAVGPGAFDFGQWLTMELVPGDVIYTPPFADYIFRHEGTDYVVCREKVVLAREPRPIELREAAGY